MSGTQYVVDITFKSTGDIGLSRLSGGVSRLDGSVSRLQSGVSQIGSGFSRLMAPVDYVAGKVFSVAESFAKWAVVGGIGAATYGVVGLNNELEKTKISLGTIFSVQGKASNLAQGMSIAQEQMAKMRKDAAALPGEFSDLVNIFTTASIPGFQGGLSVDQMRQMSAKIMAAGFVANLPMDQVARESAMLMSGRAGAHNVFGMKLMGLSGDAAEKFNKLAPEQRVAKMSAALDKFAPSIEEFGKSFEGISTSFIDNGKQFLQAATSPLFEKFKSVLQSANAWFTDNGALVRLWAAEIGNRLGTAFDIGVSKVREWWPAIRTFAENAYSRLVSIWETVQPYVERFGTALQDALKDPGTIDKLIHLVEAYGALKLGGAIAGGIGAAIQIGGAIASGGATSGAGIGAAAGAIGGAISGAAGSAWAALTGGATLAGTTFVGLAGAAVSVTAGLVALVGAGAALYQGWGLIGDVSKKLAENDKARLDMANSLFTSSSDMDQAFQNTNEALYSYIDANNEAAAAAINFASAANATYGVISGYAIAAKRTEAEITPQIERGSLLYLQAARDALSGTGKTAPKPLHPGGGGGTNIQKVEIVVTSNQEPSRIARDVRNELANLHVRTGRSPDVVHYGRPAGT